MPEEKQSVDDTILRYADSRSAEEISTMLGGLVSPVKVAERRKFLLTSRNPLDQAEQESLVLYKLRSILADMEGEYQTLDSRKLSLAYLKQISAELKDRKAASDDQLNRLYANQAQIMFQAVSETFSLLVRILDVEEGKAREALSAALPQAVLVISERNSGEGLEA